KYLLGALALLALGLLLVPGPAESDVPRDVAGGQQEPPVPAGVTVSRGSTVQSRRGREAPSPFPPQQEPPPPEAGSPPSLQSMSLLLDRLAKENQDIRLMQAELQAHKEELQALLRRSEDEAAAAGCARKEGMEPVQRAQFLQLLQGFLERQGWGRHLAGVTARLDGAFGPDGTFAHDRLRFVDFVDDAEELLEELARREGGDEEAADGFEEFVLHGAARPRPPRAAAARGEGRGDVRGHAHHDHTPVATPL
uniref:PBIP1 protein n=1 Tax=Nothoprocta perdicaria TaxID=30464 RepID=A0A8C6ZPW0_NOTPE